MKGWEWFIVWIMWCGIMLVSVLICEGIFRIIELLEVLA